MAQVEPMDVDNFECDFDNKENSLCNSNAFPKTSCTEKGYEELDCSEFNMKLRYSTSPESSLMSRSYTANCSPKGDAALNSHNYNVINDSLNLTRSLNSTVTKTDNILKSTKLHLQVLPPDVLVSNEQNSSLRSINTPGNVTFTVTASDDDVLSLPSTPSSTVQTPEATTPTKEVNKSDSGSPIMRGLKSVLNMFRSSQNPMPPEPLSEDITIQDDFSDELLTKDIVQSKHLALPSAPIANIKTKDNSIKRSSPLKERVVFNDDLERELQWKNETINIITGEKYLKKRLSSQTGSLFSDITMPIQTDDIDKFDTTVGSLISNSEHENMTEFDTKTVTLNEETCTESDSEFLDCETPYTKNKSYVFETVDEHNKTIPIVIDTLNVYEICHEDYIKPDTNAGNTLSGNTEILESEKKDKPRTVIPEIDNLALIPTILQNESLITTVSSRPLIQDTNESFSLTLCGNNNNESQTEFIGNNSNILQSDTEVLLSPENEIQKDIAPMDKEEVDKNNIECLTSESCSYIQESDEHNQIFPMTVTVTNFSHESDLITSLKNINTANTILDNYNESQISSSNYENYDILLNDENMPDDINEPVTSDLKNFVESEDYLLKSIIALEECLNNNIPNSVNTEDLAVVSTGISEDQVDSLSSVHDNVENSFINHIKSEKLKGLQSLDDIVKDNLGPLISTFKIGGNTNECKSSDKTQLPNCSVGKDYALNNNFHMSTTQSSQKGKHLDFECNINTVNNVNDYKLDHCNNLELDNDSQLGDASAENMIIHNLETTLQLFKDKLSSEVNNADICNVLGYDNYEINSNCDIILPEQRISKDLSNNLTFNTSLSNDIYIEKESSIDPHSIKNNSINVSGACSSNDCSSGCLINNEYNFETHPTVLGSLDHPIKQLCSFEKDDTITPPVLVQDLTTKAYKDSCYQNLISVTVNEDQSFKNDFVADKEHEGILTSGNDCLNISNPLTQLNLNLASSVEEGTEDTLDSNQKAIVSPPISSKGTYEEYNKIFDEIDDPFVTKTNIRMSPPLDLLLNSFIDAHDNQMIQKTMSNIDMLALRSESKESDIAMEPLTITNNINTQECINIIKCPAKVDENIKPVVTNVDDNLTKSNTPVSSTNSFSSDLKESKEGNEIMILSEQHINSCNTEYRNIFNLPEISDMNFNSFVTKSRICMSPTPTSEGPNLSLENKTKMLSDYRYNILPITDTANATLPVCVNDFSYVNNPCSSPDNTDNKDITCLEINTEDDDTVEGPFFETENLTNENKVTESEIKKDLTQFKDFPITSYDEDVDKDEIFIDAEAFEFLLNQNKSNVVVDSGKESLFLKFDPLFANRTSSDGALGALNSIQRKQSTPKKLTKFSLKSMVPDESKALILPEESLISGFMIEQRNEEVGSVGLKPLMAVSPAMSSAATPRTSVTPKLNRRSLSCTSPAMVAIDRLISLSGNASLLDQDNTISYPNRNRETNIALTQLREVLAEKELHVHYLKRDNKEIKEKLSIFECQLKTLEAGTAERLKKINNLNEQLTEENRNSKCLAAIKDKFEWTRNILIAEMEQDRKRNAEERTKLVKERDEQTAHIPSMVASFNDLHSKFEKNKHIILNLKAKEDDYKKLFKDFDETKLKLQNNYNSFTQYVTSEFNKANSVLDKMNKTHEAKVIKLKAMLKRRELEINSLQESLTQKTKANEKLTAMCEDLLKVTQTN